MKFWRY